MKLFSVIGSKRVSTRRRGSAMVEVAVCFPVFLMILLGIIEFGRAMSVNQLLNSAARMGCRAAILDGSTNTTVSNSVKQQVSNLVGCAQSVVTVAIAVTDGATGTAVTDLSGAGTGDVIKIDVAVPFSSVSWSVAKYLRTRSVRGECAMQHE
jgi:Flp pilus assembly protein TadG